MDEQKNAPELPIGRFLKSKSPGGNRVILNVMPPTQCRSCDLEQWNPADMAAVTTKCQFCGTEIRIEYQLLGAAATCTTCHHHTAIRLPSGTQMPSTQWELTCHDFRQLIQYKPYRSVIAPLLNGWFGYQLCGDGRDTLVLTTDNETIDPIWLHLKIQGDADKQYRLYQIAMSLWR